MIAEATEGKKKKRKRNKNKNKTKKHDEDKSDEQKEPSCDENQPKALKDNLPVDQLFADSDQSEDEGIVDYKIGGYHPVHIGEVLINRYVIL